MIQAREIGNTEQCTKQKKKPNGLHQLLPSESKTWAIFSFMEINKRTQFRESLPAAKENRITKRLIKIHVVSCIQVFYMS